MHETNGQDHGKEVSNYKRIVQGGQKRSSSLWVALFLLLTFITVLSVSMSFYTIKVTSSELTNFRTKLVTLEELCRSECRNKDHVEALSAKDYDDMDLEVNDDDDDDGEIEPESSGLSGFVQRNMRGLNQTEKGRTQTEQKMKGWRQQNTQPSIRAAHFIPDQIQPSLEEGETKSVDCGEMTPTGIQVKCEITTFWQLDPAFANQQLFYYANGVAIVIETGYYYIYSQVTHHDISGSWSYSVVKQNNSNKEEMLRCQGSEPHLREEHGKTYPMQHQCHSSRAVYLRRDDQISVRNPYHGYKNRVVKLDKTLSFWGLIWLSK